MSYDPTATCIGKLVKVVWTMLQVIQSGRGQCKPHPIVHVCSSQYAADDDHDETQCIIFMQDAYGNTPLIKACERGYVETARILLDHGTYMDHRNKVESLTLQA